MGTPPGADWRFTAAMERPLGACGKVAVVTGLPRHRRAAGPAAC